MAGEEPAASGRVHSLHSLFSAHSSVLCVRARMAQLLARTSVVGAAADDMRRTGLGKRQRELIHAPLEAEAAADEAKGGSVGAATPRAIAATTASPTISVIAGDPVYVAPVAESVLHRLAEWTQLDDDEKKAEEEEEKSKEPLAALQAVTAAEQVTSRTNGALPAAPALTSPQPPQAQQLPLSASSAAPVLLSLSQSPPLVSRSASLLLREEEAPTASKEQLSSIAALRAIAISPAPLLSASAATGSVALKRVRHRVTVRRNKKPAAAAAAAAMQAAAASATNNAAATALAVAFSGQMSALAVGFLREAEASSCVSNFLCPLAAAAGVVSSSCASTSTVTASPLPLSTRAASLQRAADHLKLARFCETTAVKEVVKLHAELQASGRPFTLDFCVLSLVTFKRNAEQHRQLAAFYEQMALSQPESGAATAAAASPSAATAEPTASSTPSTPLQLPVELQRSNAVPTQETAGLPEVEQGHQQASSSQATISGSSATPLGACAVTAPDETAPMDLDAAEPAVVSPLATVVEAAGPVVAEPVGPSVPDASTPALAAPTHFSSNPERPKQLSRIDDDSDTALGAAPSQHSVEAPVNDSETQRGQQQHSQAISAQATSSSLNEHSHADEAAMKLDQVDHQADAATSASSSALAAFAALAESSLTEPSTAAVNTDERFAKRPRHQLRPPVAELGSVAIDPSAAAAASAPHPAPAVVPFSLRSRGPAPALPIPRELNLERHGDITARKRKEKAERDKKQGEKKEE